MSATLEQVPIGSKGCDGEVSRIMSRQDEHLEVTNKRVLDWRDMPRWSHLRDVDRVYLDPHVNDRTLWMPRVDVFEEDAGSVIIEVELPGVPKEDINLIVDRSQVTICALKPHSGKEARDLLMSERHFGRFFRRLELPFPIDVHSVRAHLRNGLLHIHAPLPDTPAVTITIQDQ